MVRGRSLVRAACVAVLASCCLPVAPATPTGDEAHSPWLPFPLEHHAALSSQLARPQEAVEEDAANMRIKRVFLSRGWGPGGYDAPAPPPPQRYVRRPPLPQSPGEADTERPFPSPLPLRERGGGARFAALVSSQQQEAQQKPQYRRFHSIFTSGTWSPLGKRGAATLRVSRPLPLTQGDNDKAEDDLQNVLSDRVTPIKMKDKRSGVFASHGWGAGGSSPPSTWAGPRHPWLTSLISGSADNSGGGGGGAGGGDRYVASFSGSGPLFHHFLSHGWRPMGR